MNTRLVTKNSSRSLAWLLIGSSLIVGMGTRTILFETVKVHEDKANGDEDGYAQGNGAANGTRYAIFR